ncbi:glycosyltransferase, partial [Acinetobacter baumannii]
NPQEIDLFKNLNIAPNLEFCEIESDTYLAALYRNALALIYPSIYEGFGFPIVEAFSQGCPVITSEVSSMKEIGGDAAIYFDPLSPNNIKTT